MKNYLNPFMLFLAADGNVAGSTVEVGTPAEVPATQPVEPKKKRVRSKKKAEKPKAKAATRMTVYGHSATSVIRRLAKAGYKFPAIKAGLAEKGVFPSDKTTRVFLSAGRHDKRGTPAKLSREDLADFKAASKVGLAKLEPKAPEATSTEAPATPTPETAAVQ